MERQFDALFVNPDSSPKTHQGLREHYSAVEPPTWALLLAESCRSEGFGVGILDTHAEQLSAGAAIRRVEEADPRLVVMVVYGQNPNSGTVNMAGRAPWPKRSSSMRPVTRSASSGPMSVHYRGQALRTTASTSYCTTKAYTRCMHCCRAT